MYKLCITSLLSMASSALNNATCIYSVTHHSKHNLWGDHPWLGGITYGAVDSPGGPSMAAIVSPGGPTMATKFAVDGPGDQFWGTTGGVTEH